MAGRFTLVMREAGARMLDAEGRPLVVSLAGVLDAAREARQQAVPITREDIARRIEEAALTERERMGRPPRPPARLPMARRIERLEE